MKLFIVIFLLTCNMKYNLSEKDCALGIDSETQESQPMYFLKKGKQYNLAKPVLNTRGETDIVIDDFDSLIVSCMVTNPITRTSLVEESFTATCQNGDLKVTKSWLSMFQGTALKVEKIKCGEKLKFRKKTLEEPCSGEFSKLYEIGVDVLFRHNSRKILGIPINFVKQKWLDEVQWHSQYSICFDKSVKEVLYTMHTINGTSIKARQTGISDSEEFKFGKEFRFRKGEEINPKEAFILDDMEKGMIEDASFVPYFNYEKKNLIAKTLVPPKDMLFFNWKPATYFYLNVAPMWRSLECTWENLEKHIRIAASRYETDLIVYTGVYEKYLINNRVVTLDKNRRAISVPFYFWKIVYHRINRSGIAFVMNNDPFEPNPRLCKPEDKRVGRTWPVYSDAYRLGLLYPCLVEDLREILKSSLELPEFKITQELYYPTN